MLGGCHAFIAGRRTTCNNCCGSALASKGSDHNNHYETISPSPGVRPSRASDTDIAHGSKANLGAIGEPLENDKLYFLDDEENEEDHSAAAPELPPQDEPLAVPIRKIKPKRHPGNPTKEEIDAHNLTHANYRSWCAICSRAASRPALSSNQTGTS